MRGTLLITVSDIVKILKYYFWSNFNKLVLFPGSKMTFEQFICRPISNKQNFEKNFRKIVENESPQNLLLDDCLYLF
jgi:hypothetical protein